MKENEKQALWELQKSWNEIKNDRFHGAAELLRSALYTLRKFLETVEEPDYDLVDSLMRELTGLRTDMAGFSNCVRLLDNESIESLTRSVAHLQEYLNVAPQYIAKNAVPLINRRAVILTNSRSSIVAQIILELHRAGKVTKIIQMESRPACEGRNNAELLLNHGIRITVIPDAAMGYWIRESDIVLVGADAISQDGSFLGKIGCYPLALLARAEDVPFYVAADRLKLVKELISEEDANREFTGDILGWGYSSDQLELSDIIFEKTPGHLVSGFITEFGLQRPPLSILKTLSF